MSRSSNRTYKIDGANPKFPSILPATERAVRTIPHVKSMMSAIRRRDQDVALRAGMVAVREMDGIAAPPPAPAIAQPAVSTEKSAPQPVARAVKHPRKRAPQAKRKPARTVATSSR
ncbi:MAG: hypothetical protein JST11_26955 [Acidobacteria bacterium]|nr:hypothetical protein [Acidobacteriota bacterium]